MSETKSNVPIEKKEASIQQRDFFLKRAEKWAEIKSFEQEYKRSLEYIDKFQKQCSDTAFEIQKRLDWIQKEAERIDSLMYKYDLGEFSPEAK